MNDFMQKNIIYYERTGSTNEDAKRLAKEGAASGTVIVADSQDAGKGRRGRDWISPPGSNLYFSLLLKPDFSPDKASMLTLVMALSVEQALERMTGIRPGIKWPNDIVLSGKKICGILTEMTLDAGTIEAVVIGVGVNVSQAEFAAELKDLATSLFLEGVTVVDRMQLLNCILEYFDKNYEIYLQSLDLSGLKEAYEACLVNRGKEVRVLDPSGEYEGKALGINESGELLVETADGRVEQIFSGEVSVRGIYGYV